MARIREPGGPPGLTWRTKIVAGHRWSAERRSRAKAASSCARSHELCWRSADCGQVAPPICTRKESLHRGRGARVPSSRHSSSRAASETVAAPGFAFSGPSEVGLPIQGKRVSPVNTAQGASRPWPPSTRSEMCSGECPGVSNTRRVRPPTSTVSPSPSASCSKSYSSLAGA